MRLNYLLDFYQALLTPKQREYMNMYYSDDLSLVEISELANVSRQAVYDNIKRTEGILEAYEDKLGLYEKFEQRKQLLEQLESCLQKDNDVKWIDIMNQLKELG